jgi:hypothetical protein
MKSLLPETTADPLVRVKVLEGPYGSVIGVNGAPALEKAVRVLLLPYPGTQMFPCPSIARFEPPM